MSDPENSGGIWWTGEPEAIVPADGFITPPPAQVEQPDANNGYIDPSQQAAMPSPSIADQSLGFAQAAPADQILMSIGDIGISRYWIVTPNGSAQLSGSAWIVRDMTRTETKTPTWAIIVAVIGFWICLLPLLFLLVKETTTTGYVEVQVQAGHLLHLTQIPVSKPDQIQQVRGQVSQAQSMAAAV